MADDGGRAPDRLALVEAPVGSLSGGSQQKVMIARWLASESRLLILEEPTRGVDIATKAEIYHVLENTFAEGEPHSSSRRTSKRSSA